MGRPRKIVGRGRAELFVIDGEHADDALLGGKAIEPGTLPALLAGVERDGDSGGAGDKRVGDELGAVRVVERELPQVRQPGEGERDGVMIRVAALIGMGIDSLSVEGGHVGANGAEVQRRLLIGEAEAMVARLRDAGRGENGHGLLAASGKVGRAREEAGADGVFEIAGSRVGDMQDVDLVGRVAQDGKAAKGFVVSVGDGDQNAHSCYYRHVRIGITCYPTYGGSGIVATELGLELANRGHQVHFITYANPIRLGERAGIQYHEVEVSNYPLFQYPPYCLALASRMAEVAEQYSLDLLHVHYAIPHSVSAMLAKGILSSQRRLPFVTTLHGTDITLVGMDRSYFPITKHSIEQSDAVTAISEDLRQHTVEVFDVTRPITTIHNFVNSELYRPAEGPAARGPRMIHLSNFRPVKRVTDCIRVLAEVRKTADAELWMVGDGPERGAAEHLAHDLGLIGSVRFLGKRNDVPTLLREADVLLMPSEMESFGLAALEGMSSGVVPVGTNVGGVPELITDGVDGYLCDVGDVERMAARAAELLTEPDRCRGMGLAARRTAVERFSTDLIIPKYEALYRQVVEAG